MKAEVQINMGSSAFLESPTEELARIIRDLANELRRGEIFLSIGPDGNCYSALRDVNGNTVGSFTVVDDEGEER